MKKIIYSFIVLLINTGCFSQNIISLSNYDLDDLNNNNYIKDTNGKLNPFIGTWKWVNGNSEFIIQFVKKVQYNPNNMNNYSEDIIIGGYKYIEDGILIVDALTYDSVNFLSTNYIPIISSIKSPFEKLSLTFFDRIKQKTCHGSFTFIDPVILPNGQIQATEAEFIIWDRERFYNNSDTPSQAGFSIPNNVILTKI